MDDLNSIVSAVTRTTFFILSALFFGWAFFSDYRPILSGLILGLAVGLVYTRFLSMKVRGLVEHVVSQQKKRFSFGFLTRICLVLLVIMVAVKVGPQLLDCYRIYRRSSAWNRQHIYHNL